MKTSQNKIKINSEEHRSILIDLYFSQKKEAGPFMKSVLNKAINSLKAGVKPRRVENFVVKMEKLMRSNI